MGRLDGKVALISGSARGMGAHEARMFVDAGAKVMIADILEDDGAKTAAALRDSAFCRLDVTDEESWAAAVAATIESFGSVDVLVNNAGLIRVAPIRSSSVEDFRQVVEVNQVGVFLGMRAVIDPMTAAGGGSIINISSSAGMAGAAGHVAYCATKWAVRGMTKVAALELAPLGIRVNSVHPGPVDTALLDAYRNLGVDTDDIAKSVPLGRLATPDDIAPLVLYLASDESRYSTGAEFVVDGGLGAGRIPAAPRSEV